MTLRNLVGRSLEAIEPDKGMIQRLLAAAKRNINDAHTETLSDENRFDMGYKAIKQLANAALQANGFRTLTSVPGHHQTMLQSLGKTIGLDNGLIIELDALRKQRNVADYSGDLVPESSMLACLTRAEELMEMVSAYLKKEHPELME